MGMRRSTGMLVAVVLAILLVTAEAWVPLGDETVHVQREPLFRQETFVNFQGKSVLIGEPAPDWLATAIAEQRFALRLDFMTFWRDQSGPARIFAISNSADDANLMIGQDQLDLVIRVRRANSSGAGEPEFRIEDVLVDSQPQQLDLTIDGRWMTVALDGERVRNIDLAAWPGTTPVGTWDPAQRVVIGDEAEGGFGWIGGVFEATVGSGAGEHVLIASGELSPGEGTYEVEQARTIHRPSDTSPPIAALRILLFVPLGFVIGRLTGRRIVAAAVCTGIVLVLAVGKLVVPGRHPSLVEIVLGLAGSAIGIALSRMRRRASQPPASVVNA